MSSTSSTSERRLNHGNINPHVKNAQYAVRGELAVKSEEYRARLNKGDKSLPFDKVISANIGNPQQLDQKPITFFRQVLSLVENPLLLEHEDVLLKQLNYKPDVIERAKWLLSKVGSVGAYSASNGVPAIRQRIADFLESEYISRAVETCQILTHPQDETASQQMRQTSTFPAEPHQGSTPSCTPSAPTKRPASSSPFHSTPSTPPPCPS